MKERTTNKAVSLPVLAGIVLLVALVVFYASPFSRSIDLGIPVPPEVAAAKATLKEQHEWDGDPAMVANHERNLLADYDVPDWDLVNSAAFLRYAKSWESLINVAANAPRKKSVFIAAWYMMGIPGEVIKKYPDLKEIVLENSSDEKSIKFSHVQPVDPGNDNSKRPNYSGHTSFETPFSQPFTALKEKMEENGIVFDEQNVKEKSSPDKD